MCKFLVVEGDWLWRHHRKCDRVRRVKLPIVFLIPIALASLFACSGKDATGLLGDASVDATADAKVSDASDAGPDAAIDAKTDAPACKLTAPYSTKNQGCNVCAEAHCCTDINACYASKDCDEGYVNCVIACALTEKDKPAYDICAATCAKEYPTGAKLYDAFSVCIDKACAPECAN